MKIILKLFLIILPVLIFVSCNNEEKYENIMLDIATVENPNNQDQYFFRLDDNTLMWTEENLITNYIPVDGQRILAYYNVLTDRSKTGLYDYDVKLLDIYPILTKNIFQITPEQQDSIGNDSIVVKDIWVGSDYLNVDFVYTAYNAVHFINLVSDTSKLYTDGKTHLEFRHNSNNDLASYYKEGLVSFNLKSLQSTTDSTFIDLVIHVNEPNVADDKLYELKYEFGEADTEVYRVKQKISKYAEKELYR